jgi:hypothetical protein
VASKQAELRRSVRKGPLITVTCKCGQAAQLHYGEQWKCPRCGRKFDTSEIPREEYAALRRQQLRVRVFPLVAMVLLVVAVIVLFVVGRPFAAIVAIPFLIVVWNLLVRPRLRSR